MVVVDLEGNILDGDLKPSSDTVRQLYIYRHRADVNGVVHTHSNDATAFAALGKPIPVYLTAQDDGFGGPIPCGRFVLSAVRRSARSRVNPWAIRWRYCSSKMLCSPSVPLARKPSKRP